MPLNLLIGSIMKSNQIQIIPGALVEARDGFLGTVLEVILHQTTGEVSHFLINKTQNDQVITLPISVVAVNSTAEVVYVNLTRQEALQQGIDSTSNNKLVYQDNTQLRIPLVEEQLKVDKKEVQIGEVLIHRTIEEFEKTLQIPISRDDIVIERVTVNQPTDGPVNPYYEGDWMIVPLVEEVLVVTKRFMITEHIRIGKRTVVENKEVSDTLRREHVEFEEVKAD